MLTSALFLCSLLLPQAPQPAPANLDVVELQSGELLTGRIVTELDDYLEIEVAKGAIVGCSRGQIRAVHKGAGPLVGAPPVGTAQPFDAWFLLHNGAGKPVGWLHSSLTVTGDGNLRLSDEWQFEQGDKTFAVTELERATASLQPLSSYYHERVVEAHRPHAATERIVEAVLQEGALQVTRLSNGGRDQRRIEVPADSTFPLLLRQRYRMGLCGADAENTEVSVFDAATEELRTNSVQKAHQRTVELDGKQIEVTELCQQSETGRNVEWIDASLQTVRREIAGPALVAVPSDMDTATAASPAPAGFPAALACEAQQRFGLWAPNPGWQAPEKPAANQVVLDCALRQARASLVLIDHLDAGTSLDGATAAVQRWFQLLHPELAFGDAKVTEVRLQQAMQFHGEPRDGRDGLWIDVYVMAWHDGFLALSQQAPKQWQEELAPDFAALLRTVELDRQGIAPLVQGPLLSAVATGRKDAIEPGAPPVAAERKQAGGVVGLPPGVIVPKPLVTVPKQ